MVLEHDRAAAVDHEVRGRGRLLEHRAARAEIAVRIDGAALGCERQRRAAGSRRSRGTARPPRSRRSVLPLTVRASPCSSGSSSRSTAGSAARVEEVLHQVLARRPHVGEQRRACARARRSGAAAAARPRGPRWRAGARSRWSSRRSPCPRGSRSRRPPRSGSRTAAGPRASAISTARRPDISASARRRESAAGMAALPGSAMPSASAIAAIVDAVPITMQCPLERERQASTSAITSSVISPARALRPHLARVGARAELLVAPHAAQHRPARHHDRRHVGGRRAHQHGGRGLVAAGEQHDRRRADRRGCIPRRPSPSGCGRASWWASSGSRRARSPGTRAGSRPRSTRRA